jgi:hypothetical protein
MVAAITIIISILALGFSVFVFANSGKRDRRDLFLHIHQQLLSDQLQRGRFTLFRKVTDEAAVDQLTGEEYRDVNAALSFYNTLGFYVKSGYVKEHDVMELWDRAIWQAWIAAQPFMTHRQKNMGYHILNNFEFLAGKAREELIRKGMVSGQQVSTALEPN